MSTLTFASLEQNLFQIDKLKKKGFKAILNLNYLPELLSYIKTFLSKQELACLNDYEAQNLLIETCFSQLRINRLIILRDFLLNELRKNSRYWVVGSEVFLSLHDGKIIRDDNNMGGIELYRKYIQKIDEFSKECKLDQNFREEIPTINIILEKSENIVHKNLIDNQGNEKMEEEAILKNGGDSEIFARLLDLSDTQRLTRHQKKQLFGENMNATEFKKFINQTSYSLKKKKELEIQRSIFYTNKFKKFPKIEFQIFPFIFGFLKENEGGHFDKKLEFHLQNFLLFVLLQEKPNKKKFRINQNLFKDTEKQALMTLEEEGLIMTAEKIDESKSEIYNDNPEILKNFIEYCDKKVPKNKAIQIV
jgi:hypothetical protein